jgi:hypothetical protein
MTKAIFAKSDKVTFVKTNPKRKNTKANARWTKYSKAKTVGAAMKAGALAADVLYDVSKGFATVKAAPAPKAAATAS